MSDILSHVYNNCNPLEPASATHYVDLTDVRGGDVFVRKHCEELDRSQDYVRVLFTGHQGCGKSSELEHFAQEIRSLNPKCPHKRYFPVVVNVLGYVDLNDASLPEILLSVVAEIAAKLREEEGIELKDSYFQKRWAEIKGILYNDVKLSKIEFPLWQAKAEINLRETAPTQREEVRKHLLPQMTNLIGEINTVLVQARTALRAHSPKDGGPRYEDIVLILDNMEKILRISERPGGEDSERALFIEGAALLTGLRTHVIYTVPLRLVRAAGPELALTYGRNAFVLPNVKTEKRATHAPWEPGRQKLREMLEKRTSAYRLELVFAEDALDFLFRYCGGHVRQFMVFAREATLYTQETPISLQAVQSAVRQSVQMYASVVRAHQWQMLAELELDQAWDNNDEERRDLLEQRCVLEYLNGGDENIFESSEPWYAVHPIVRELRHFRAACDEWAAKKENTGANP